MISLILFAIQIAIHMYVCSNPESVGLREVTFWWKYPVLFPSLCLLQLVCKKTSLSPPSKDIEALREFLVPHFQAIGRLLGTLLNVSLLYDHVLEPLLSSFSDVLVPMVRLLFSWLYVLVGFASVRRYFFATLGALAAACAIVWYYDVDYTSAQFTTYLSTAGALLTVALVVYPGQFKNVFPTISGIFKWMMKPPSPEQIAKRKRRIAVKRRTEELMQQSYKCELVDLYRDTIDADDNGRELKCWYAHELAWREIQERRRNV